jgi:hypothetical protein
MTRKLLRRNALVHPKSDRLLFRSSRASLCKIFKRDGYKILNSGREMERKCGNQVYTECLSVYEKVPRGTFMLKRKVSNNLNF